MGPSTTPEQLTRVSAEISDAALFELARRAVRNDSTFAVEAGRLLEQALTGSRRRSRRHQSGPVRVPPQDLLRPQRRKRKPPGLERAPAEDSPAPASTA
jgi:hypothetical protein